MPKSQQRNQMANIWNIIISGRQRSNIVHRLLNHSQPDQVFAPGEKSFFTDPVWMSKALLILYKYYMYKYIQKANRIAVYHSLLLLLYLRHIVSENKNLEM